MLRQFESTTVGFPEISTAAADQSTTDSFPEESTVGADQPTTGGFPEESTMDAEKEFTDGIFDESTAVDDNLAGAATTDGFPMQSPTINGGHATGSIDDILVESTVRNEELTSKSSTGN